MKLVNKLWMEQVEITFMYLRSNSVDSFHKNANVAHFVYYGKARMCDTEPSVGVNAKFKPLVPGAQARARTLTHYTGDIKLCL